MWHPGIWTDLEGLLGESETPALDFKRTIGSNEELAKDIAAMTVNGGLLIYGVDEDESTCAATDLLPFPIAGVEEKLAQVTGTRISPAPAIQVRVIPSPDNPTVGVIAVEVPASSLAPHQANARFPCRRGTTTDYLEEREVERLYRQRRELSGPAPGPGQLLEEDFTSVLDGSQVEPGTCMVRLVVRPATNDASHPAGAWQGAALDGAIRRARERLGPRVGNISTLRSFSALSTWQANGAEGWGSTNAYVSPNRIAPQSANDVLIGASLAYPACLSFHLFFGLRFSVAVPSVDILSARELDVLYELLAVLTLSGEYLSEVDGSAHLLVELGVSGFAEAWSQMAIGSSSTGDLEAAKLPGAPDTLTQAARTSAGDLRQAPEKVARTLLERWLPAFYVDDRDLFTWAVPP
jgi:hypothetical protein